MATSVDTQVDLVINRLSRDIYNELSAIPGALKENELYLIEDENFDVFNKRITNVQIPLEATDAVNLNYLSSQYVQQGNIIDYVDNSRIYGERKVSDWDEKETCIDGRLNVYTKLSSSWICDQISGPTIEKSRISVAWQSGFGWKFKIDGEFAGEHAFANQHADQIIDTFTFSGNVVTLSATCWNKTAELAKLSAVSQVVADTTRQNMLSVYKTLSSITTGSTIEQIVSALTCLNATLSTFV